MYLFSLYNLLTTNRDIDCSHLDEWIVYSPVLSLSNERNLNANKVCRLNIKLGFESFNDVLAEYNLHNRHVSIKKYVRKEYKHDRIIDGFDRPVIIGINTAEEIPLGILIDFMIDQERCDVDYEHNCRPEKFKTSVTWDIQTSGHFGEILNRLRNLLLEDPKDKLYDIAIQFIIELRKNESDESSSENLKTMTTGIFTFIVGDDNITLSCVDENDFYLI